MFLLDKSPYGNNVTRGYLFFGNLQIGHIPLDAPPSGIPANEPVHLRLWMNTNEFMGPNQTNVADWTFTPAEGVAYHVVHIDNPGRIRFELEASDGQPVEITSGCAR